jgi:hypothetical protein
VGIILKIIPFVKKMKKPLFITLFIVCHILIAFNFYHMSKDTINGDISAINISVHPLYKLLRIPEGDLAREYNAVNRISGDFAQIYFPARSSVSSPLDYTLESNDPWGRPSRYAPFVHAVCHYTLCRLDYGYAAFLHIVIQLMLLYASLAYAFRKLNIKRHIAPAILLINVCLFLTPVGLAWFERGQLSLFVALAYLWLFLGIIGRNPWYLLISAVFAFLKWTSFPFIFVACALWILTSRDMKEFRSNMLLAVIIPVVIALLFLFHVKEGIFFLKGLYNQEMFANPTGISLLRLFPKYVCKLLPFILVILGYWGAQRSRDKIYFLIPYLAGSAILLALYPTVSPDYVVPCLFGFIPVLIYWEGLGKNAGDADGKKGSLSQYLISREYLPRSIVYFFFSFLLAVSCFKPFAVYLGMSPKSLIVVYAASAILIIAGAFRLTGSSK